MSWQTAGADAGDLARRDRRADAGAAHEDAALGIAAGDRRAELERLVRVVDPHRVRVGAEVDDLVPAGEERLQHLLPQVHAAMIEGDRDDHVTRVRNASARATMLSARVAELLQHEGAGADAP